MRGSRACVILSQPGKKSREESLSADGRVPCPGFGGHARRHRPGRGVEEPGVVIVVVEVEAPEQDQHLARPHHGVVRAGVGVRGADRGYLREAAGVDGSGRGPVSGPETCPAMVFRGGGGSRLGAVPGLSPFPPLPPPLRRRAKRGFLPRDWATSGLASREWDRSLRLAHDSPAPSFHERIARSLLRENVPIG